MKTLTTTESKSVSAGVNQVVQIQDVVSITSPNSMLVSNSATVISGMDSISTNTVVNLSGSNVSCTTATNITMGPISVGHSMTVVH